MRFTQRHEGTWLRPLLLVPLVLVFLAAGQMWWTESARLVRDADRLSAQGDFEAANKLYATQLRGHPDNLEALRGLAVNLFVLGQYEEALGLQERVVRVDPEDAQTRVELGLNYLAHQGEPVAALRVLGEAALLDPSPRNRSLVAKAMIMTGRREEARQELRATLKDFPNYPFARDLLQTIEGESAGGGEGARREIKFY